MTIMNGARHEVGAAAVERALTDIEGRAFGRWHRMEYDCYSDAELRALRDDLLDHLAARTLSDPRLRTERAVIVARTAAECALGYLDPAVSPPGTRRSVSR
ncbi:hypothetical protein GCM10009535_03170 [Streptomyces thermocarboxydovorans]|uniref:Uncharacterized protein n=1 Tax=Streptomyces thermocarboxydovorans TaxID=59298 RepID=A0ABN1H763_9ACTN